MRLDARTGPAQHQEQVFKSPLVFDPQEVARAESVAVLIPGALTRTSIFVPTQTWASKGYARVFYRFPGLDGRPLAPALVIEEAAAQIVEFATRYPGKALRLLGYSTGGPIAISAAEQIDGDVKVAAMSSAVERAGGATSLWRTTADVLSAAAHVGSVNRRKVFLEYYKTLLFGRRVRKDAVLNAQAAEAINRKISDIVFPERGLFKAHSDDLRRWRLVSRPRLSDDRLRFFVGGDDPVFGNEQTKAFALAFGQPQIVRYPGDGHLLFLTRPKVFDDILTYFEGQDGFLT